MPFPFFTVNRMKKVFSSLGQLRYRDSFQISEFSSYADDGKSVNTSPKDFVNTTPDKTLCLNDFWEGRDSYLWLSKEVVFPKDWTNKDIVCVFDFGSTGGGGNSGFESLLYINGSVWQGVDENHKEIFLNLKETGCTVQFDFRLWSGLEGGGSVAMQYHQIKTAFAACLDKDADELYYLSKNIIETIAILDDKNTTRYDLENVLVKAFQLADFTSPGTPQFYDTIKTALTCLKKELSSLKKDTGIHIDLVGHTHIDVAWLWQYKHTREKAARSFSTVHQLMKRYPEYIFLQTQAQLYHDLKTDFPEIYSDIKDRVKEKKWEPSGAMWVEADCNIPSGESLVRQILYGKNFFMNEFGYDSTYLWLPDVFGYSWALPQILQKSGIKTFMTTKISWNEVNKLPYDTFMWRGIDGSEILTHFITTPEPNSTAWFYTYNGKVTPETVDGIWKTYSNKDLNRDLLLCYGHGDGGGGVDRDMLENKRAIAMIPSLPSVASSTATDYFEKLHATWNDENNNAYRPVWNREIYLEFHRGTYTSQAYNKMMNRYLELIYRDTEILHSLIALKSKSFAQYPASKLEKGWQIILINQFHDVIPGSSIHEVYEDSREQYDEAKSIALSCLDTISNAENASASPNISHTVFNSAGFTRNGHISLPSDGEYQYEDESGKILASQVDGATVHIYLENIASFGCKGIVKKALATKKDATKAFNFDKNKAESPLYCITWNDKGQLTSIFSKKLAREVLTDKGNVFEIFEDKPRLYDAWELESTIDLKKQEIDDFKGVKLISCGECFIKLEFSWGYNKSTIAQNVILYANLERIDFETTISWYEKSKVLKTAFPVDVKSTKARYDIQYGSLERPTHHSNSWDFAMFEVVAHQWADLAERGFGVALLNNCKYGYDIQHNRMRLTLLKSAENPDPTADEGIQQFTYSILPHSEEWYESALIHEAWDLNSPLRIVDNDVASALQSKDGLPLFELASNYILVDAIKKTEDGNKIIFRCHETSGGQTLLQLKLNFPIKCWYEADLMEHSTGEKQTGSTIEKTLSTFEIFTVIIEIEDKS